MNLRSRRMTLNTSVIDSLRASLGAPLKAYLLVALTFVLQSTLSFSAESAPQVPKKSEGERINVENIKEKYWAQGEESELGVVQNRTYSKARRIDFGLFGGTIMNDPFLNVKSVGGNLGYHFDEYFSLHLLGWKAMVSGSGAYTAYQERIRENGNVAAIPPTNDPIWYAGTEAVGSFLYGKLSVLGKAIIYYDMHVLGGVGLTGTETGRYITPHLGLGQKVYISKNTSIRLDYRLMYYNEVLVNKISPFDQAAAPTLGQPIGNRSNWSNSITLGIDFLFGSSQKNLGVKK